MLVTYPGHMSVALFLYKISYVVALSYLLPHALMTGDFKYTNSFD